MENKQDNSQPWTDEDSEWLKDEELSGWGWGDEEDAKMSIRTERLRRAVNEINRLKSREKELSEVILSFVEEIERTRNHLESLKAGMQVPFFGDFASISRHPGLFVPLERWAKRMARILDKGNEK